MSGPLQEETVFAGRYRVVRCLAQGGMGAVYEVIHLETERRRALKVMHPHILQSEEMRQRFKLEAKVAAHIESDFIVDVFDAGIDEATELPFLVMELLRGEELGKRLTRLGRLPPGEVVMHLHQAALALDKTHKASIVHRDLKPENLFLAEREDSPPRIKVLDFGIAKIVAESATVGGPTQIMGTPLYMSPEQFNPNARLTGASDIYALGMIAYTLLVGVPYWYEEAKAGNVYAVAAVASHGPPQPATVRAAALRVALPPTFDPWFARVTAVNLAHRFPTATAAVRALAEALGVPLPGAGSSLAQGGISAAGAGPVGAPGPNPLQTPGTAAISVRAAAAPAVTATELLPALGPGSTSLGASMTRPIPQKRVTGGLIAFALFVGAWAIGGALLYALRSPSEPSPAAAEDLAKAAPPAASTEAAPPPAPPPAATIAETVNPLDPVPSADPGPPAAGLTRGAEVQKGSTQKTGGKARTIASAKASPAPSTLATTPPKRPKYTQE
jgi:eukaryotic-like serine/threonine-protein kinase